MYTAVNPFEDNKYDFEDDTRRDDEKRAMWETEDLVKLFGAEDYITGNLKHPAYYWVPLILLHTGARSNEICQLHLNDIQEDAGVHYFSFKPDTEDKKLKNKGSKRNVPIHQTLLDAGLLEYANKLKATGAERLFPELSYVNKKYDKNVSRWFNGYSKRKGLPILNGYKRECGIIIEKGGLAKDLHSFRHTLATLLDRAGVPEKDIGQVTGHSAGQKSTVLGDTYIKRKQLDYLKDEVISKLDYSDVWEQIGKAPKFEMASK